LPGGARVLGFRVCGGFGGDGEQREVKLRKMRELGF